jgi:hypothetical protein
MTQTINQIQSKLGLFAFVIIPLLFVTYMAMTTPDNLANASLTNCSIYIDQKKVVLGDREEEYKNCQARNEKVKESKIQYMENFKQTQEAKLKQLNIN